MWMVWKMALSRREFLQLAAAAAGSSLLANPNLDSGHADSRLSITTAPYGLGIPKFGLGYAADRVKPGAHRAILKSAGVLSAENWTKFWVLRPTRDEFVTKNGDEMATFAAANGKKLHGHCICWHHQNPGWLLNVPAGEMGAVLEEHIQLIAGRWGDHLYSIDVVNEAYVNGYREPSPFSNSLAYAFELAAQYLPNARRVYNSWFVYEKDRQEAEEFVQNGLAQAIGHQFHLSEGYYEDYPWAQAFIDRIQDLGADFYFSEVGVQANTLRKQAQMYRDLARLAANKRVERFVVWGVKDPAWRGDVTLFDSGGNPKPAYYSVNRERVSGGHSKYRII